MFRVSNVHEFAMKFQKYAEIKFVRLNKMIKEATLNEQKQLLTNHARGPDFIGLSKQTR